MDWLLLAAGAIYVGAIHAEIQVKMAKALLAIDARVAPNWIFAGLKKEFFGLFALFGGVLGAALTAYDLHSVVGSIWALVTFLAALYFKYLVTERRSMALISRTITQSSTVMNQRR